MSKETPRRPNVDDEDLTCEEFQIILLAALSRVPSDERCLPFAIRLDELFERIYDAAVDLTSRR